MGWAASAVLSRAVLLDGVSTWTLIPIRMAIALATLLVVMMFSTRFRNPSRGSWGRGSILGIVSMAVPMILMTMGLEDLPVSLGSLLIALIPIATIASAHFVVPGERFRVGVIPGLAIALLGTALLVGVGGEEVTGVGNLWRGVGVTIGGVVLAGMGSALSRRFALEVPAESLVLPQFTVNTVFVWLVMPLFFEFEPSTVTGSALAMIAVMGTLGTTVAFTAFLIGAGMNPASRLALTGYSVPVVAVTLAVIFLGETLTLSIVAGAALIIAGVVISERATGHVPEPGVATSR